MSNTKPSNDTLGFSVKEVEEVEREFEFKLEQLDILGAKRDLLVGQLLCEYRPRFIAIVEASDQYNGKLETYYRKRFDQDPSNVQRYMRVWEFWSDFALKDNSMTVDDLAKYPNTSLDSARRLHDIRQDAVLIIGQEVHLNPVLVTDGRGTHLADFTRPDIDRICKNVCRQQERIVSLANKGIAPDGNGSSVPADASVVTPEVGNGVPDTRPALETGGYFSDVFMPVVPAPSGLTLVQAGDSTAQTVIEPTGPAAQEPDDSTASLLAVGPVYPRTFRGKDWPASQGTVSFAEGDVTTENSGVKFIYRAVNCRVQVVVAQEGAEPQVVIRPVDTNANGSAVVWLSGQYDDDGPVLTAYTYDAQLGLGTPTQFVKMDG